MIRIFAAFSKEWPNFDEFFTGIRKILSEDSRNYFLKTIDTCEK